MSFYLKTNNIDGSVTTKGHDKSIAVESFEFGVSRRINVRPGHVTDREEGVPKLNEVVITKILDKASPYLFENSCTGVSLEEMKVVACGSSSNADQYLQYILSDVSISKYDIMGNDDHETHQLPTETINVNFTKSAGYNIETAKPL